MHQHAGDTRWNQPGLHDSLAVHAWWISLGTCSNIIFELATFTLGNDKSLRRQPVEWKVSGPAYE